MSTADEPVVATKKAKRSERQSSESVTELEDPAAECPRRVPPARVTVRIADDRTVINNRIARKASRLATHGSQARTGDHVMILDRPGWSSWPSSGLA
jgi:hypothetical protein